MILNEVNGYCSITCGLVMVDMQTSCIELVCVKTQITCGSIQTPQHVLNCRMIGSRADLRTADEEFRNWIDSNKLLEL